MADKNELLTAGKIAAELGIPGAKVKKAIESLGLKPDAKKGPCCYYSKSVLPKIKAAAK